MYPKGQMYLIRWKSDNVKEVTVRNGGVSRRGLNGKRFKVQWQNV